MESRSYNGSLQSTSSSPNLHPNPRPLPNPPKNTFLKTHIPRGPDSHSPKPKKKN